MEKEYVVLVDRKNNVLGTSPKLATHNKKTPLHRGFSIFIFNNKGQVLLQKRSKKKKTWPSFWSNSCCGHPKLNESNIDAAKRRVKFELGLEVNKIYEILPNFSYKVEEDEIVENEICPVLIGFSIQKPNINKDEVENIKWINWNEFIIDIRENPEKYSPWCILELKELLRNKKFISLGIA